MRKRELNMLHAVLMVFIFAIPVILSAFEKGVGTYASLFLFAICTGYGILKNGYVVLSKTSALMMAMAIYSFLQLLWVSDKGSQVMLGAVFFTAALASLLIGDYKKRCGAEALGDIAFKLIYSASMFYSVMAVLHQILIETGFLGCNMDFGGGSASTSAFVAVFGLVSTFKLFGKKKRQPEFYVATLIFAYVLIMAKSFTGYLFAFAVAFAWYITRRHKRLEALVFLAGCVVTGVLSVINAVAELIVTKNHYFNGAIKGLVSVFGIGCGGYNAASGVVDGGYKLFASTLSLLTEAYGIVGIGFAALVICCAVLHYMRRRSYVSLVMIMLTVGVLVSSSATLALTVPLVAMYYTCNEDAIVLYMHKSASVIFAIVSMFALLFTLAHIPYAVASHHCDMGRYDKGGECYSIGAQMEIFNSHGWEKSYKAYMKQYGVEEAPDFSEHKKLIGNAIKFNKKNYGYYRDLAEVYTAEGDYIAALETWDEIILRHDKEYLYPKYAQKIHDVMKNCPVGLETMQELYERMDTYAKKAVDKDIVFEMNNILAKSQQYYVNVREGTDETADMYIYTEDITEAEYESSSTEG